jgi:hypothetical protein
MATIEGMITTITITTTTIITTTTMMYDNWRSRYLRVNFHGQFQHPFQVSQSFYNKSRQSISLFLQ